MSRILDEYESHVVLYDTDAAGVVYVAAPSGWFQRGLENLYRAAGHPLEAMLSSEVDYPVVNLTINHRNILRLGDRIKVRTGVGRVGNTSVTYFCAVLREDGEVAVEMEETQVAVYTADRTRKRELEPWVRALAGD